MKMTYETDREIIEKTTRCKYDHQCLVDTGCALCPAERLVTDVGVLLKNSWGVDCDYLAKSLTAQLCTCPVRQAVYDRYGE